MAPANRATRLFINISNKSPYYQKAWDFPDGIVDVAVDTVIGNNLLSSRPLASRILLLERWNRLFIVIDVNHDAYDPDTAHLPGRDELPVIEVHLSRRQGIDTASASTARIELQQKVNEAIRERHNQTGKGSRPPFRVDHANGNVPTYMNPRTLIRAEQGITGKCD